ncbi:PH domain-containing protein [Streptomyces axinellae]|uniref:Low molecular weight protein antigen 6 PH domain-containing protein n=1 Tax=Streptomyces axinellae TaxID=552788 RepID=A0ABP6D8L9_9ACTN
MTSEHERGSGEDRTAEGADGAAEAAGSAEAAGTEGNAPAAEPIGQRAGHDGPEARDGHQTRDALDGHDGHDGRGSHDRGEGRDGADEPRFADRVFRSPAGMAGGVVLLALGVWLVTDAVIGGAGRTPWLALAGLLFAAPLVVAFTLRPAVFAGEHRLRVRNPFRTIEIPWGTVETIRAGYSSEVVADGAKYQMWAIPVSLRARKKATRHNERVAAGKSPTAGPGGLFGGRQMPNVAVGESELTEKRAASDQAIAEIRDLAETHGTKEAAQGSVAVRWSFEVLVPVLAGAVLLAILFATRQ